MSRNLEMGVVGKPHGIKGELGLVWHGEKPPVPGQELILASGTDSRKSFRINSVRIHKGRPLVFLEGILDRIAAEALQGAIIYISSSQLDSLEEDEAWLADLIGLDVFLENGACIGRLDHVEFPAGQEIWSIIAENGREILFPAQPGFLAGIDEEAGKIFIRPPEGLLEIYNNA